MTFPPGERRAGMVCQSYALYPDLSSRANVLSYVLFGKKTPELDALAKAKCQRTSELMGVELEYLLDRKPGTLSGGEKQRGALGRCIIREPALFAHQLRRRAALGSGRAAGKRANRRAPGRRGGVQRGARREHQGNRQGHGTPPHAEHHDPQRFRRGARGPRPDVRRLEPLDRRSGVAHLQAVPCVRQRVGREAAKLSGDTL